jgi:hypothetical protein
MCALVIASPSWPAPMLPPRVLQSPMCKRARTCFPEATKTMDDSRRFKASVQETL